MQGPAVRVKFMGEGGRLPTICVAFVSAILADTGEDLPLRDGCILPNILFLN